MGEYLQSWTPYRFRSYYEPGGERGRFDESEYTEELHAQNLALLERTMEVHADGGERTPWLTSGIGVVAVERSDEEFDFSSVSLADDKGHFGQGLHFLRQDVTVHPKKGLKARTRMYPTLRRIKRTFTDPTAASPAQAFMYPTISHNPGRASEHLQELLEATHELEPATTRGLKEIFPLRPMALRYWVGVRAGE
jgi:hypothetical protein